jgi:hypothetical protein
MHLQIALTVISFVLSVPVILTAYKSAKIIGWQIYKKIGSSISLQSKFGIDNKKESTIYKLHNYYYRHVPRSPKV